MTRFGVHFYQLLPLGGPDQPMLEVYTLLGALAAQTRRMQLGALVTGVTYRNPGILAKIITTLDVISRGRAILGIGGACYDVVLRRHCAEVGRDPAEVSMTWVTPLILTTSSQNTAGTAGIAAVAQAFGLGGQ